MSERGGDKQFQFFVVVALVSIFFCLLVVLDVRFDRMEAQVDSLEQQVQELRR